MEKSKRIGSVARLLVAAAVLPATGCGFHHVRAWDDDDLHHRFPVRVEVRGAPVVVGAGEIVEGDLVVVGGDASVDGEVRGDLVVVAGRLRIGAGARIGHDLVAVGNEATEIAPGIEVGGSRVSVNFAGVRWMVDTMLFAWDNPVVVGLVSAIGLLLGVFLAWRFLLGRYDAARFHDTVDRTPVRAGLAGFLVQVALSAVTIAAFLTPWTVGLTPALCLAGLVLLFLGWLLVAGHVGWAIAKWRGWNGSPFWYGLAGFGVVFAASCIPIAGQIAALVGSCVGLGALLVPAPPAASRTAPPAEAPSPDPARPA